MKKEQCKIVILPQDKMIYASEGDSLYTLLLVEGILSPDSSDRVRLEKGAISPADHPEEEATVFNKAELAEGWMLAAERHISGDAVLFFETPGQKQPGAPLSAGYGLVVDAGTGTVAAGLVNMVGLNIPYLAATRNSQQEFGQDVPSRQAWLRSHPQDAHLMAQALAADIDVLVGRLTAKAGIDASEIKTVTIAANHVVSKFLLGEHPRDFCCATRLTAGQLHLQRIPLQADCYLLPDAAVDIGSDTVAGCLSAELMTKKDKDTFTVLVDLGVSSEIILAGQGRLLAASVPTMPFEGGDISCGTYAVTGAITRVFIDEDVTVATVRDGKPVGICGAGLISAIHALLEAGLLNEEGRLLVDPELPERLVARFSGTVSGRRFVLSPNEQGDAAIYLDQDDIRQFQLAKGGVYAACQALLAEAGAVPEQIEQILLAESYGAHIRPVSALAVGLLPAVSEEKVRSIGNAAWQGAYLALSNQRCLQESEELAAAIERVDLSANMVFAESFMSAMNFGS